MKKLLLVVALVALGLVPVAASAQQSMTEQAQDKIMSMTKDMDMHRVLAIGAGVVVGAVVADARSEEHTSELQSH